MISRSKSSDEQRRERWRGQYEGATLDVIAQWVLEMVPVNERQAFPQYVAYSVRLILDCCGSTTPPAQRGPRAYQPARPRRPA